MGGIAGIVHFRGEPPESGQAERMAALEQHRGPDGAGAWADGPAAFAHRLRRVRPGTRVQPAVSDDLVVMLDGWIYNHLELVRDLPGRTDAMTDTEALLVAWRRWGTDTLMRLEGEFAFAVWDRRAHSLVLARDRLGVRPLHYAGRTDRFAFSSEIPPLLDLPWVSREPELGRIAEYLSFGIVHSPRTLLRDVHQVEPGSCVRVDAEGVRARTWWRLRYAPAGTRRPREGDVIPRLQEVVDQAVRKRAPTDVSAGQYLSGGLGSAAIAAAARREGLSLPGFTVSFDDDPHPEAPFAGRVARLFGIAHHQVTVGTAELAAGFDDAVRTLGQPVANPGVVLQLALARAAREHVRIVLSGDGGEELFGGQMLDGLGSAMRMARWFARLPAPMRASVTRGWIPSRRVRKLAVPEERYPLEFGLGGADLFSADQRAEVLRDPALVRPGVRREVLAPFYDGIDTDPINTVLHGFLRSSLGEAGLTRADRSAATMGLDVRFPLLDRDVVEAAAALPGSFKLRRVGGSVHTRWPLRALLAGQLPEVLVDRPKRGLPAPLGAWLGGPGRLFLEERCERLKQDPLGLWNPAAIEAMKRDVSRSNAVGNRLWALFALDQSLRR